MTTDYTGCWKLLFDWQTLVAGVFALIAGYMAFKAGREQAKVVEKQNEQLKRSERRTLSRTALIAARLLDGVLVGIEDDLKNEENYIGSGLSGTDNFVDPAIVEASRKRIHKPALEIVWNQLGVLDQEWIRYYMQLDREILKLSSNPARNDSTVNSILDEIRRLQALVSHLRQSLAEQSQRGRVILEQTD